uniref:GAS domain-containing protein n=1 Tax=Strongyloides papillosus TaxID=174720 RepID=A0A0N5BNK8_STREA
MEKNLDNTDLYPDTEIHKSTLKVDLGEKKKSHVPMKKLMKPYLKKKLINNGSKQNNKNNEIKQSIKKSENNKNKTNPKKDNILKVETLTKKNEQLKKKVDSFEKKTKILDEDRYRLEKEKEIISNNWERGKSIIYDEQQNIIELHKKLHRMKSAHAEYILSLQKKIRSLSLKSEIYVSSTTQTENVYLEGIKDYKDEEIQTVEEINPNTMHAILRGSDTKLMELITRNEREKMQMQSDYKFNMTQLEQNLKKEQDMKLRMFKNEKDTYIEEICANHSETIAALEKDKENLHLELSDQISQLQIHLYELTEELKEKNEQNKLLKQETMLMNEKIEEINKEKEKFEVLKKSEVASDVLLKKEQNYVASLKKKISSQKDIIDIVLGEFRKLELERDSLIAEFEKCIGASNSMVKQKRYLLNLKMTKTFNDLLKLKKEREL